MTQTIGFIGAGMIGGQLARMSIAAGFNVILGNSRSADTITDLVKELGDRARAATAPDAARGSDLVVAAIPFGAYTKLPAEALVGKIVIDTMNYYPERDGIMPEVKTDTIATSELLRQFMFFRTSRKARMPLHQERQSPISCVHREPLFLRNKSRPY